MRGNRSTVLADVLCMQIPLVFRCGVVVAIIFGSKTMMFRSHVSISCVVTHVPYSKVRLTVCTTRHGRDLRGLRRDVVNTYPLVRGSSHDHLKQAFSALYCNVLLVIDVFSPFQLQSLLRSLRCLSVFPVSTRSASTCSANFLARAVFPRLRARVACGS